MRLILLTTLFIPCFIVGLRVGQDFHAFYGTMELLKEGALQRLYDPLDTQGRFYYLPHILIPFHWMGHLNRNTAHVLWLFCLTLSYVSFWGLLYCLYPSLFNNRARLRARLSWIVLWIVSIAPIHASFQCQNIQLFIAATLLICEWLRQQGKSAQFLAGILCTLVATLKLYPLFIVGYYLLVGPKFLRRGIGIGILLVFALPLAYFGGAEGLSLFERCGSSLGTYHGTYPLAQRPELLSLPSLFASWTEKSLPAELRTLNGIILVGAIALAFYAYTWKMRKSAVCFQTHLWALAMGLSVLLNSTSRQDYFIFYLPSFASVMALSLEKRPHWLVYLGTTVGVLLMSFTTEWVVFSKSLNDQLELWRIPVLGMLSICGVLASFIVRINEPNVAP